MVSDTVDPQIKHADQTSTLAESVAGAGALRAESLKKSYRRRCVVNDVSIIVQPGEIVGLLGPNGAGKTTTFYMV
ncbi:MAG: ATP-binding cassette domain-containing protein, partial [Blastocatellia bacterium]